MDEWALPSINMERCTGCGTCVDFCPTRAVELIEARPIIVRPADCAYCGLCEETCPQGAIELAYEIASEQNSGGKNATTNRQD